MSQSSTTPDIDFLPASYRDKKVKRQTNAWRGIVVTLVVGAIAAAGAAQLAFRCQAERELSELKERYIAAQAQTQKLAETQRRLKKADDNANLYAYLQHPWPKTQVLGAVVEKLPSGVTLRELRIVQEEPHVGNNHPASQNTLKAAKKLTAAEEAAQLAGLSPAARDLRRLRETCDHRDTIVLLTGTADDAEAIQQYLQQLSHEQLFVKVEWGPIERDENSANDKDSVEAKQSGSKFTARLIVRPGYGQPGGPAPSADKSTLPDRTAESHSSNANLAQRGQP